MPPLPSTPPLNARLSTPNWWLKLLAYGSGLGFLLPLPFLAWFGTYSRYVADDFSLAAKVRELGLIGAQEYWYRNLQGCFTLHFVLDVLSLVGPFTPRLMPTVLLVACVWGLSWMVAELSSGAPVPAGCVGAIKQPVPLFMAGLITVATLLLSPAVGQSFFWETGAQRYITPLVLGVFQVALMARWLKTAPSRAQTETAKAPLPWRACLALGLLAFVAGAFNEIYMLLQVLLWLGATLAAWRGRWPARATLLALCGAGLGGALLAAVIVIIAPGNATRQAAMPHPPGLLGTMQISWFYYILFLARNIAATPWLVFFGALFSVISPRESVASAQLSKRRFWTILGVTLGGAALIFCAYVPTSYATSGQPPYRAVITPCFIWVCTMVTLGYVMGLLGRDLISGWNAGLCRLAPLGILLAGGLAAWWLWTIPVGLALGLWMGMPDAQARATLWDQRDQTLRAAHASGLTEVTAQDVPNVWGLEGLNADPAYWTNQTVAAYYGLKSVHKAE